MKKEYLVLFVIIYFTSLAICFGQKSTVITIDGIAKLDKELTINYSLKNLNFGQSSFLIRFYFSSATADSYKELKLLTGDYGIIEKGISYSTNIPYSQFDNEEIKIKISVEEVPHALKNFSKIQSSEFLMGNDQGDNDA